MSKKGLYLSVLILLAAALTAAADIVTLYSGPRKLDHDIESNPW
jgi:hypothetical protein